MKARGLFLVCILASSFTSHFLRAEVDVLTDWVIPSGRSFTLLPQEHTAPIVYEDLIFSGRLSGELFAINRETGNVRWSKKMPAAIDGSLALFRAKLFVGDTNGNLWALDARDGSEIWKYKASSAILCPVAVGRDKVVVQSSDSQLVALGEASGKELWQFIHRGDEKMTIRGNSTPVFFGNDLLAGFADGSVVSLNQANGTQQWEKKLRGAQRFYDVEGKPFAEDSHVIFSLYDGRVAQLNRMTGEPNWSFPVGSYGGVLVEGDTVFFSGLDGNFYAIDKGMGVERWHIPLEGGVGSVPVRNGKYLIVATAGDPISIVDPDLRKVVGKVSLGTGTFATPAVHVDSKNWYVLSNYGNLFAFEFSPQMLWRDPATIHTSPTAIETLREPKITYRDS